MYCRGGCRSRAPSPGGWRSLKALSLGENSTEARRASAASSTLSSAPPSAARSLGAAGGGALPRSSACRGTGPVGPLLAALRVEEVERRAAERDLVLQLARLAVLVLEGELEPIALDGVGAGRGELLLEGQGGALLLVEDEPVLGVNVMGRPISYSSLEPCQVADDRGRLEEDVVEREAQAGDEHRPEGPDGGEDPLVEPVVAPRRLLLLLASCRRPSSSSWAHPRAGPMPAAAGAGPSRGRTASAAIAAPRRVVDRSLRVRWPGRGLRGRRGLRGPREAVRASGPPRPAWPWEGRSRPARRSRGRSDRGPSARSPPGPRPRSAAPSRSA